VTAGHGPVPIRRRLAGLVAAVLLAGACGSSASSAPSAAGGSAAGGASPSTDSAASAGAGGSSPAASPSPPSGTFVNPVLADDFPDPFVLRAGDQFFAYATTDGAQHLQLARSPDLVHWEELDDPLPKLASWSSGDTWAPEVAKTSAGYVLYYTSHDPDLKRPDGNGSQCITLAVAAQPQGPFVDRSTAPLVCQADKGGSIDATAFRDADGTRYLIWKNDGNCCNLPTRFTIQPLTDDGLKLTGKPTDMGVVNDAAWEGSVIEAPTLLRHGSRYYLFYSANAYDSGSYAIGYATATRVRGPYHDSPDNPLVKTGGHAAGPGHQSIVADKDGDLWMAYHAWSDDAVGYGNGGMRELWIDPLTWNGDKPVVHGPSDGPEPAP
jgi:beta-xylosidase